MHAQRPPTRPRGAPDGAAARRDPPVRPHRHERRLRRRGVRRLRRAPRRRPRQQLPDAAGARRGRLDHHHRRGRHRRDPARRSRSRFSSAAARSAASARRAWCSPRTSCCRATTNRPKRTCASRSPATCAAAPATCASSSPCSRPRSAAMIPLLDHYELVTPASLEEALDDLARHPAARPFAGGTDLMVVLEAGHLPPGRYVSLQNCRELLRHRRTATRTAELSIGALTTYTEIRNSARARARLSAAGDGGARNGRARDAEPRHDRRQHRQRVARGRHAAGAARLRRGAGDRVRRRRAARAVRSLSPRLQEDGPRAGRAHRARPSSAPVPGRRRRTGRDYYRKVGTRRAQAISKVCFAGVDPDGRTAPCRTCGSRSAASRRPSSARCARKTRCAGSRSTQARSRPPSGTLAVRDRADRRHPLDGALSRARRRQPAARLLS